MNSTTRKIYPISQQRGATLIVSLVILAIITMLGIASMRSSNLELKMAASARDRAVAIEAAESALASAEKRIGSIEFQMEDFLPTCNNAGNTRANCFRRNCNNGLCFSGDLEAAVQKRDCQLAKNGIVKQHWRDDALWSPENPARNRVLMNGGADISSPRYVNYMVEFMCFVPKDSEQITDEDVAGNGGVPLFQVTVRATGEVARSKVILQSIYKGKLK